MNRSEATTNVAFKIRILFLVAILALGCRNSRPKEELVVFHAASLSRIFSDLAAQFQKENPTISVRLEPSGSQVAARKVVELGMQADLVAVADASIIDRMLVPGHARFRLEFATNEIVLAHKDHSRFTDEISTDNWPSVLLRPELRLACANPDLAPIGYHTIIAWQLAERSSLYGADGAHLADRMRERCIKDRQAPDETELVSLLESRAAEYAFIYRTTAEDHHLKITALPPSINLSRRDLTASYAATSVQVRMKQRDATTTIHGSPIVYGLTILNRAAHPAAANKFVEFLLGDTGQRALLRAGFHPLNPAVCSDPGQLPESMRPRVVSPQ